jgi:hypothetical protein
MRILNILIILGCLVGGYWLVSSIMSPGIDVTRRKKPEDESPGPDSGPATSSRAHDRDWHLILDIPSDSSRRDIEAAFKRRLAKAESAGDDFEAIRIRRAYEAAIRHARA